MLLPFVISVMPPLTRTTLFPSCILSSTTALRLLSIRESFVSALLLTVETASLLNARELPAKLFIGTI